MFVADDEECLTVALNSKNSNSIKHVPPINVVLIQLTIQHLGE